ncbi:nesprin-4 isoform X2 [Theropithecus gelada]|uniref:Spectrin repeat containing nuclear envelope family member 4 n=1 Tax=Theropithecus gelada TaxID=9565 RepID=A0A8D2EVH0_THEGE|nr:nesprin-4 isoform X2 [Theropithecus gelada]
MALSLPLGPRLGSEPFNHPPGAPREPDIVGCTVCPASGEESTSPEQAQTLRQDSLDPPEHFQGGPGGNEPAAQPPRWSTPSSYKDPAGGKHCEVFEEANTLDQDLEFEGDLDWPARGGVWGPWAPSSLPTSAELEWDPAGDIGGLGPLGQKTAWTLGVPCELCGHRGPQGRGQGLEEPHTSHSRQDMLESGLSYQKHLAGHQRRSLLRKPQDKKRQASPHLHDVRLEGNPGAPDPASRRPLTFLLILFLLFLLLVGAMFLLPVSGGPCCSNARIPRTPYLVLSYVNGLPPV